MQFVHVSVEISFGLCEREWHHILAPKAAINGMAAVLLLLAADIKVHARNIPMLHFNHDCGAALAYNQPLFGKVQGNRSGCGKNSSFAGHGQAPSDSDGKAFRVEPKGGKLCHQLKILV